MKLKKYLIGSITQYQGTRYKDGDTYFTGNTGIHSGSLAVLLPEVSITPQLSAFNLKRELLQSPMARLYLKDKPLSGTDPVGQFIVEGAVLGKPTQYLLDKGLTATVGSTSGELLNKALSGAKSLYYNKAPWTFKPNPNSYYRAIPREAIDDAIETGVIRHKPKSSKFLDLLELKNSPDPDVASKAAEEFSKLTLTERLNVGSMADSGQTYFLKGKPWTQKYSQRYGQQDYGTYGDYFIEASDKVPFIPIKTKGRLPPEVMKNLEKNYNPEIKGIAIPKANVLPEKTIPLDENVKLYKPNWFYGFKEVPKPDLISNKMLASEDVLELKKPLNVREALDFILKGSKSAKEFVLSDVVKSSAKRNIDLYNRINKTNIGYNEYSLAPGLTTRFVDNFDSFTNTNSPTGNTSCIGGIFDCHNNQLIFKRSNVTEPTVFHENLHSFGYGNKVYNQMRNKYIVDPEKIKGLSEIAKKYYVTGGEPAVHYAELGKTWGVKPGDVYPGRAIVEEMINSKGLSGAPFFARLSTNRDYKRFWDAISGNYFSTIPIVGTASLYNSINKNK